MSCRRCGMDLIAGQRSYCGLCLDLYEKKRINFWPECFGVDMSSETSPGHYGDTDDSADLRETHVAYNRCRTCDYWDATDHPPQDCFKRVINERNSLRIALMRQNDKCESIEKEVKALRVEMDSEVLKTRSITEALSLQSCGCSMMIKEILSGSFLAKNT